MVTVHSSIVLGVLGWLVATTTATVTKPAVERELVIANKAARTINEVYASPSSSDDWGRDRLGDSTIEPGSSTRLRLPILGDRDCRYDLEVVYSDASREERRGVDVCHLRMLAFDGSHALAPSNNDTGEHRVTIANQTTRPIQQVLISPAEAGDWGDDRLANQSISVGDTMAVSYVGSCLVDIRVVFDNQAAEERRGIDVCAQPGLVIAPGWTTAERVASPRPDQTPLEPLPVTVVNHAGRAASELYIYPESAASRGPDLLDSSVLEDGGQIAVVVMRPHGTCRFAAHVVYGGKVTDQDLSGLDLCRDPLLRLPPRS